MNMSSEQIYAINVIQQVLRTTLVALCGAAKADPASLANLLTSGAANEALEPMAQKMLADLAVGISMIERAGKQQM